MRTPLLLLPLGLLAACGPREPGPHPGETIFWELHTSSVEFGQCSDVAAFRDNFPALPTGPNTFLVYQVDASGAEAVALTCARKDASACAPTNPPFVFTVAGSELVAGVDRPKRPVGGGPCNLATSEAWLVEDKGERMELAITITLSLVDDAQVCADLEAGYQRESPNGLGVNGCTVTLRAQGRAD
jgi:hypothetical protein